MNRLPKTNSDIYSIGDFAHDFCVENNEEPVYKYKTYLSKILKEVNDLLLDEVILNNYRLKLGNCIEIKLVRIPRNFDRLAVNWGASNKLKKEILDRGGVLTNKIGVTENGNPKFDDGEKWMVFFTDEYYITLKRSILYIKYGENATSSSRVNPNSIYWHYKAFCKSIKRVTNYEKLEKINKLQIPLHVRNQNNFI